MKQAQISIIDDEPDIRAALSLLLKSVGHSVETYESAQNYWDNFDPEIPGCLILDVRMPGMSGLELQEHLKQQLYHPPIIMISGHGEIPMAVKAIQDGAIDFLQKPFSDQLLLERVQQALTQDEKKCNDFKTYQVIRNQYEQLTDREREVMSAIVQGQLNKVVAYDLDVSTRTIEIHRARVMEKMEVSSVASLVRKITALEEHVISAVAWADVSNPNKSQT